MILCFYGKRLKISKKKHKIIDVPFFFIDELICYYVLFRKIISPSGQKLIPENEFKLFAIATRFPNKLSSELNLIQLKEGVYRLKFSKKSIKS